MRYFLLSLFLILTSCAEIARVNEETRIEDCMKLCFDGKGGGSYSRYECGCYKK